MPRPRLLAPLLALPLACSTGGEATSATTTGFESGPPTSGGPGPDSFGTSSSTELPTTDDPTTASTTVDPSTSNATTTTDATTTATTTGSSTGAPATCGDGVIDPGEFCDDGNQSDADACLADCHPGTALLVLAGLASKPALALLYDPELGWTSAPTTMALASAELEATPTGALAAIRRSSAVPAEDDELWFSRWSPGDDALFPMFAKVGAFGIASDGPSLAAVADTVTLAFLGTDNKHYSALFTSDAWAPFAKIPAGKLDIQAFGPSAAVVIPGQAETYAVYTGDDARIYYSSKPTPDAAWAASQAAPPAGVVGSPVGLVDPQADLLVAYVRKADGKLAVIKLLTPQNAWTKEALVHPEAITGTAISLARLNDGRHALAWRGFDNDGIYLALATDFDVWDAPQTVELPPSATTPPLLVPGATGADLEILYTAGGKLRHARLQGDTLAPPSDVPGVSGAVTLAATRVQLAPGP